MDKSRVRGILAILLITALILPIFLPSMMATVQTQNQLENVKNQAIISSLNSAFSIQPVKSGGEVSTWITQTVDSVGNFYATSSLAFDSSGNPAISYGDVNNHYLKYAHWNDSMWVIEIVDSRGDPNPQTSLAFDAAGNPAISYYNGDPYYDLKYAHWNGASWDTQVVFDDGWGAGWTRTTSLAFDSNGNPAIAFRHQYVGLRYAHWNGIRWNIETVDSGYGTGAECCLRFDHFGNPAVAYWWEGVYQGPGNIRYAYFDGNAWNVEIVSDSPGVVYPSLAFDSSGNPAISYSNIVDGNLYYAHWNGGSWSIQVVDGGGAVGAPFSLAFDCTGNPAISYYDSTNKDLKYAHSDGSRWNIETVDSQGDVGCFSSLAFNSLGNPAISYCDYTNLDLEYAFPAFTVEIGPGLNQLVNASAQMGVELYLNLTAPVSLIMVRTMENMEGSAPSGLAFLGRFVSIAANDTAAIQGITITIHYTDQEVTGNRLNETSLAIWYWNETSENWVEPLSTVDTENNIITAWVNHLTLFAVLGIPASSVIPITLILLFLLFYMVQPHISFPSINGAGTVLVVVDKSFTALASCATQVSMVPERYL